MVGVWGFGAGVIFLGPQRELKRNPNDWLFESVLSSFSCLCNAYLFCYFLILNALECACNIFEGGGVLGLRV